MLNQDLIDLSKARLQHAEDCLREAHLLLDGNEYKGTANRAYYAAFHALRAVLVLDGFDSKKRSGIIAKFRECYLKTGLFDKEMSDSISSLFRIRSASDYDDFYIVSKNDAAQQLEKAEKIVKQIKDSLTKTFVDKQP